MLCPRHCLGCLFSWHGAAASPRELAPALRWLGCRPPHCPPGDSGPAAHLSSPGGKLSARRSPLGTVTSLPGSLATPLLGFCAAREDVSSPRCIPHLSSPLAPSLQHPCARGLGYRQGLALPSRSNRERGLLLDFPQASPLLCCPATIPSTPGRAPWLGQEAKPLPAHKCPPPRGRLFSTLRGLAGLLMPRCHACFYLSLFPAVFGSEGFQSHLLGQESDWCHVAGRLFRDRVAERFLPKHVELPRGPCGRAVVPFIALWCP